MKTIFDLWHIAKKDLIEFTRDKLRLVTFFIMPIFMMVMVGFIFPSQNSIKNLPIGLANQDGQSISQQFVDAITNLKLTNNTDAFKVKTYSDTNAIKEGIKKQEISGGLFIPVDFSKKLMAGEQAEVTIVQDQSNPQISQMVNQVLSKVVEGFSQQMAQQKVSKMLGTSATGAGTNQAVSPLVTAVIIPVKYNIEGILAGNPNYFEFIAPGIMAMIVMTAVLMGLAASVAREKEQGTLDGLLISPISRLSIILGKALSQAIRGLVQGMMVLLLAFFLFGVTLHGSILLVILFLLLGIFSFVGLGILVSAVATEQETAAQILGILQFPMLFLSGVFFPILMMPPVMQKIAYAIPLTYAISALRKIMVLGAGLGSVHLELLVLLIFGVVTLGISVPVFKRVITK